MVLGLFQKPSPSEQTNIISYTNFIDKVESGEVSQVWIRGNDITLQADSGNYFKVVSPDDSSLIQTLRENDVEITAREEQESSGMGLLASILISWFPMFLLIGVWIWFMRSMQGKGGGGPLGGFGKSKHKVLTQIHGTVTFADVAGVEEAKQDLQETVEFLQNPTKFTNLGGKMPTGLLMVGPPGTGKTLLARSVAGEAGVPFFTISGSDFVEMFVGVGASRVRDLFEQAKKNAPCIVFIDEIDAVGRHRGAGLGGGNDEREQTLNQILVEMDGFEANEGVVIIAATNRPDVLDPALTRPGRFDRQVVVSNPDLLGREAILKVHTKRVKLSPNVCMMTIARGTPGFSGADLANLVNEAALMAARMNRNMVTSDDFELAKDKIMLGTERRSLIMTEEERSLTAHHEAGHAVVAYYTPSSDPIHKATIIPRGRALGMVVRLPEGDRISISREQLEGNIAVAMGGRVAEEITFGHNKVTAGAASDIQQVTDIARRMVTQWGMSEKLGLIQYGGQEQEVFLGKQISEQKHISEETARVIDSEIRRIVDNGYTVARNIILENQEAYERLSQALLDHETLSGGEVSAVIEGKPLPEPEELSEEIKQARHSERPHRGSVPAIGKPKTS